MNGNLGNVFFGSEINVLATPTYEAINYRSGLAFLSQRVRVANFELPVWSLILGGIMVYRAMK
jgi:hypothetical protein